MTAPRQEQVQLNEGCLFRIHMDADWLETDVIAIEFRLLSRSLPDHEVPTEEGGGKDKQPEPLKEVRRIKEISLSMMLRARRDRRIPGTWYIVASVTNRKWECPRSVFRRGGEKTVGFGFIR